MHVIFTSLDPPIVLTYDTATGRHYIWVLRDAKKEVVFSAKPDCLYMAQLKGSLPGSHVFGVLHQDMDTRGIMLNLCCIMLSFTTNLQYCYRL